MEEKLKPSEIIKKMAEIAWNNKIKGSSLERNSLLYPINTIFDQIRRSSSTLDNEAIKVATIQLIINYLDRISDYKVGKDKSEGVNKFVELFFYELLGKNYNNKFQIILNDEKNLKAAYLFYVRNCIPSKEKGEN